MKNKLSLPSGMSFVRSFQGIDEFLLKNGLKVLLFSEPSQGNVTINITYLVGSRHEGRGEAGMAHLLEHMLFKGTHKCKDVKGVLNNKGANFNATTWLDRTNYFETLTPTNENLEFALELEADRMINSTILQEDLESEMTVVRNEFEMGENNPVHVLHDQMMSTAYLWHNYGKTTIGNRSDIERVPAKSLKKFYEHYYQPDNAVLLIAGQFDEQSAIELINKHFAGIAKPTRVLDETYTLEPAQDGPRQVTLERVGDLSSVAVAYHIPQASHKDHAPIKVAVELLGDEPNGIIYKTLVEPGKSSEIYATAYSLFDPGMAMLFVRPCNENLIDEVKSTLIDITEKKAADFVTDEQVSRIKARAYKKFKQAMSNSKDMAIRLSESIACGDWRLFFWFAHEIKNVTKEDVIRVLKKYFIQSNRTLGVFIPTKEPKRVVIDSHNHELSALESLEESVDFSKGEVFAATSENIETHAQRKTIDDSVRMAFLPKKIRNAQVRSRLIFRFGDEKTITPFKEELQILPSLIWRGCKAYDYQSLKDRLDVLLSSINIYDGTGSICAFIKSDKDNYNEALKLLGQVFSEPLLLESEFNILKQREIDDYEEIKNDPQKIALNELDRMKSPFNKDSMHYVPSFDEKIELLKALDIDRVRKSYTDVVKWARLDFSLVGESALNNDHEQVLQLLNWPKKSDNYERIIRPYKENTVGEVIIDTKDKEMAFLAFAFNFPLRDDHVDYPALKVASYIFGENMNSRLMSRIREKEGISYGAGSWLEVCRYTQSASFNMYAMSACSNVAKAKEAMTQEWERFIDQGIVDNELSNAQISMLSSYENSLANDNYLANTLAVDLESNRNFYFREKIFKSITSMDSHYLNSIIKKWWDSRNFSIVIAGEKTHMKL